MKTHLLTFILTIFFIFANCSKQNNWYTYNSSNTPLETNLIRQIIVHGNSLAWVGTYGNGLFRVNGDIWERMSEPFQGKYILSLKEDDIGGIWIGTARKGAYYFNEHNNQQWSNYSKNTGLVGNNVWNILIDGKDSLWLCSRYKGLTRKAGDSLRCFYSGDGLPDRQITIALKDRNGTMWIGTVLGGLCSYKDDAFKYFNTHTGLSGNYIRALICDSTIRWVGSWDGGLDYNTGDTWINIKEIPPPVVFLGFDLKNNLWAGTWGHGVFVKKGNTWKNLSTQNSGLADNHIIDIKFGSDGKVFFATSKGLTVYTSF